MHACHYAIWNVDCTGETREPESERANESKYKELEAKADEAHHIELVAAHFPLSREILDPSFSCRISRTGKYKTKRKTQCKVEKEGGKDHARVITCLFQLVLCSFFLPTFLFSGV